jgi:hypothetical protein
MILESAVVAKVVMPDEDEAEEDAHHKWSPSLCMKIACIPVCIVVGVILAVLLARDDGDRIIALERMSRHCLQAIFAPCL